MSSELDDVKELLEYYAKRNKKTGEIEPDPLLDKNVYRIMARVPKEQREKAIRWLTENHERNYGLDVKILLTALSSVGESHTEYVSAEPWLCDACGMEFKYAPIVTYAIKHDKGIFDYCPRCGMSPEDTKQARRIAEFQNGRLPSGYDSFKQSFLDGIERRKKLSPKIYRTIENGAIVTKSDPHYFWIFTRDQDDAFEKIRLYETGERMKREASEELERITKARRVYDEVPNRSIAD